MENQTQVKRSRIIIYIGYLVSFVLLLPGFASAGNVRFIYVAPKADMEAKFGAAKVMSGYADGYRAIQITKTNESKFKKIAPKNIKKTYYSMKTGKVLRTRVERIFKISRGKVNVDYLMIDDRKGLKAKRDGWFGTVKPKGSKKWFSWPSASVRKMSTGKYHARVRLGELASNRIQARPGAWKAWESTILHESLHTQFVGEKTKWPSVAITYGADGHHQWQEFLGDQELAFEEGLGTFFGHTHNTPEGPKTVKSAFSDTSNRYRLESWSVLAPNLYKVPHKEKTVKKPSNAKPYLKGRYAIRFYKWWDVPGFYLLFSESTSTAFHTYFWENVNSNKKQALSLIEKSISNGIWSDRKKRYLWHEVNNIALEMESFATSKSGKAAHKAGKLTSSMFSFALLDILTHFGMSEERIKKEAKPYSGSKKSLAYTQYWKHRKIVKAKAMPYLKKSTIKMDDAISVINKYFQNPKTLLVAKN